MLFFAICNAWSRHYQTHTSLPRLNISPCSYVLHITRSFVACSYLIGSECNLFSEINEPLTVTLVTLDMLIGAMDNDVKRLMWLLKDFDHKNMRFHTFAVSNAYRIKKNCVRRCMHWGRGGSNEARLLLCVVFGFSNPVLYSNLSLVPVGLTSTRWPMGEVKCQQHEFRYNI